MTPLSLFPGEALMQCTRKFLKICQEIKRFKNSIIFMVYKFVKQ